MQMDRSSATSLGVAGLRAAHQLLDGEPLLLNDPAILRLLGPQTCDAIRKDPGIYRHPPARWLQSHVLLRSRYAEDCLRAAYAQGVRQYILLGAGLDTYAWRQAPGMEDLQIYEMDHPATQEQKKQLLARAGMEIPGNLHFVPIDFESVSISDALSGGTFDPWSPCFISWLGVMVYLSMDAIDAVFDWLITLPAGSGMVLTFTRRRENSPLADKAAAMGEPWRTFFSPDELKEKLLQRGFSAVEILEPGDAWRTYYAGRTDGLPAPLHASIALIKI